MSPTSSLLTDATIQAGRRALLQGWSTGAEPGPIFVKASGALLWDIDGNEYVDCTSQAWSNNIGASHERVVAAVARQAADLTHLRSNYESIPLLELAAKLTDVAPKGLNRVTFCLHGSLAVESAMKVALKNAAMPGPFIALRDGFHGRSLAAMGLSWPHGESRFIPLYPPVIRVPQPYVYRSTGETEDEVVARCVEELRDTIERGANGHPVAFIMEPIQGNGTQLDFPRSYYQAVRRVCDEKEVLLIWDEVQTGFGPTGHMWASDLYEVVPDILVFGKGIGGGLPLAGILVRDGLKGFEAGDDAHTFGQLPLSLAASLAAFEVLEEENLLENCRVMGEYATSRLREMQERHRLIGDVRGPGLLIGIELVKDRETKAPATKEVAEVYRRGMELGVIFGETRYAGLGNVVKIKPPLCVSRDQMDKALDAFDRILTELETEHV
jgi:4-aminobutyrate aminotransferase-like enzyme